MCPHTRHNCPFGLHACKKCGKPGHGAENCRFTASQTEMVPPVEHSPPPPAGPAWTKSSAAAPSSSLPAEAKSQAVVVPGFGCKGEGKSANYGVAIAPPSLLAPPDVPFPLQPSSSSGPPVAEAPPSEPVIPRAIAPTTEEVEDWLRSSYKKAHEHQHEDPSRSGRECFVERR